MKRVLLFLAITSFLVPLNTSATTYNELKKKHAEVRKELKETERLLKEIASQQKSILNEIEKLNKRLQTYKTKIRRLKDRIKTLSSSLKEVDRRIQNIQKELDTQRQWLKKKVQFLQINRNISHNPDRRLFDPLVVLASAEDISQAIRRWYYFQALARYDFEMMNGYLENLDKLNKEKKQKEKILNSYKEEKAKLMKLEKDLRAQRKKKADFLASLGRKAQLYKQMVSELKSTERKIYRMLKEAEKQKTTLTGFRKMKRHLPWPVKGSVALPFGSYIDPKFKTRVFRNGIYIRAEEDSPVRAVYDGEVIFADWIEGYGKVVILRHGEGYYTVYGGLSEITVKKADVVGRGDLLGRVGESGVLNEPALYFEVRFRGKPLNPIYWLSVKR